jgi:hypothetical protein
LVPGPAFSATANRCFRPPARALRLATSVNRRRAQYESGVHRLTGGAYPRASRRPAALRLCARLSATRWPGGRGRCWHGSALTCGSGPPSGGCGQFAGAPHLTFPPAPHVNGCHTANRMRPEARTWAAAPPAARWAPHAGPMIGGLHLPPNSREPGPFPAHGTAGGGCRTGCTWERGGSHPSPQVEEKR